MKDFSEWGLLLFSLKNCEMLQCSMSMSLLKIFSLNLPPTVKLWKWKAGGLSLQAPGWKRKMSRSWISVVMRMWAHSLGWGDGLYQLWLNSAATKKKPSKEWFKQRTGTVSQVITGDPGSFCLITLCVASVLMVAELLFFSRPLVHVPGKKGKRPDAWIYPLLKSFPRSPIQWLLPGVGHMVTLSCKRV